MKSTRSVRIFTGISIATLAISAVSALAFGTVSASITKIDAFAGIDKRPERVSSAINYLLVGSDTREGLSKAELKALRVGSVATAAGKRSDTMLLVHISKARDKAVLVSIPRDSYALIPEHLNKSGKKIPASYSKINSAFNWGGAPLLIQTLEEMTQLKIDHYIEVNFAGFARVVDSLGGIEVCTKKDIDDPKSHLVLPAGVHTLNGIEALKYVRTREFDGLGDIGRMQRQQAFMSSVLKKATSAGVLLNPVTMTNFINSSLSAVTTDEGLKNSDLITLAKQMKSLATSNVRTLTVPLSNLNYYANGVTASVLWDPILAPELWDRLREDRAVIDEVIPSPSPSATEAAEVEIIDKFKTRTAADNICR
ncbi:MAG: LytR family transcriptional regulator [Actinobacteria bacterium]|nr:LytR family transcriptional regulator [Actinomycetota bacterium]